MRALQSEAETNCVRFPVYGPRGPAGTMMQTCTIRNNTFDAEFDTDASMSQAELTAPTPVQMTAGGGCTKKIQQLMTSFTGTTFRYLRI